MAKRKPLSKKIRFEILKRDRFLCRYCGAKAPDVILHVDHIVPVKEGGTNDIENLVAACAGCNSGKSARLLDDTSVIMKSRDQIAASQDYLDQLKMMVQWRNGVMGLKISRYDSEVDALKQVTGVDFNEDQEAQIRLALKKFGFDTCEEHVHEWIENSCNRLNYGKNPLKLKLYIAKAEKFKTVEGKITYFLSMVRNAFGSDAQYMASGFIDDMYMDSSVVSGLIDDFKRKSTYSEPMDYQEFLLWFHDKYKAIESTDVCCDYHKETSVYE